MFDMAATPAVEIAKVRTGTTPLWTTSKAALIATYLLEFVQITRHGTYIDGFAGPQAETTGWSASNVVDISLLQHFFLCDRKPAQLRALYALRDANPGRDIRVLAGDFNERVTDILEAGIIDEREAAFCLLDQRTFECHWSTVERLAAHKTGPHKIELFYFLANSWFDRAVARIGESRARAWWGREDWRVVVDTRPAHRAELMALRFKSELHYSHVSIWPVYDRRHGRRIMYYMIHASDHHRAPKLMETAYRKAVGPVGKGVAMDLPFLTAQNPLVAADSGGLAMAAGI